MNDSHHDISAGLKESWMASEDPCSKLSCLTGNANLVLERSTNENRASLARIRGEVLRKCYGNDIRIKWRMENRETDVEVRVDRNCTKSLLKNRRMTGSGIVAGTNHNIAGVNFAAIPSGQRVMM